MRKIKPVFRRSEAVGSKKTEDLIKEWLADALAPRLPFAPYLDQSERRWYKLNVSGAVRREFSFTTRYRWALATRALRRAVVDAYHDTLASIRGVFGLTPARHTYREQILIDAVSKGLSAHLAVSAVMLQEGIVAVPNWTDDELRTVARVTPASFQELKVGVEWNRAQRV